MPRGLTDQMEPMPNEVRELRTALAFREQARAQWQLRAEKAEAAVEDLKNFAAGLNQACTELRAEVARLTAVLTQIVSMTDPGFPLGDISRNALAHEGGGDDGPDKTFVGGRALNTTFDVPPDESLPPHKGSGDADERSD